MSENGSDDGIAESVSQYDLGVERGFIRRVDVFAILRLDYHRPIRKAYLNEVPLRVHIRFVRTGFLREYPHLRHLHCVFVPMSKKTYIPYTVLYVEIACFNGHLFQPRQF